MTIVTPRDGSGPDGVGPDQVWEPIPVEHADGETTRPETPELEGRVPLPEEITGRASGTSDDLVALFNDVSSRHLADGFRDGRDEDGRPDQADEGGSTDAGRLENRPS